MKTQTSIVLLGTLVFLSLTNGSPTTTTKDPIKEALDKDMEGVPKEMKKIEETVEKEMGNLTKYLIENNMTEHGIPNEKGEWQPRPGIIDPLHLIPDLDHAPTDDPADPNAQYTMLNPEDFDETIMEMLPTDEEFPPQEVDHSGDKGFQENDIYGLEEKIEDFVAENNKRMRAANKCRWSRWNNGEVPYVISKKYRSMYRRFIARAFDEFHKKTCIKFVPRNPKKHRDFVLISPTGAGCFSCIGRIGGEQILSLDERCLRQGTVQHELMHTLGFFHEQSRNDRDRYIKIDFNNVKERAWGNFKKYSLKRITHLGEPYDYKSIMHYSSKAFSKNGEVTIAALKPGMERYMGQRRGFSKVDVEKINKLYKCDMGSKECYDRTPVCARYKRYGFCPRKRYQRFMMTYCSKSCGFCKGGKPCKDVMRPDQCGRYKDRGFCTRRSFQSFMKRRCQNTCDLCD